MGELKPRRLTSWKEIAGYLGRDVRTAIRWERHKQLPVHHETIGNRPAVFAYSDELDRWWLQACTTTTADPNVENATAVAADEDDAAPASAPARRASIAGVAFAATSVLVIAIGLYFASSRREQGRPSPADILTFHFGSSQLRFRKRTIALRGRGDLSAADVNRDGIQDLVIGGRPSDEVTVLLGKGDGSFAAARELNGCRESHGPAVADLDGDGFADIVAACHGSAQAAIWWGRRDGAFEPTPTLLAIGPMPLYVRIADLNGDGLPDLVADSSGGMAISVLINQGHRRFLRHDQEMGFRPRRPTIADIDGDGRLDVLAGCEGEACVVKGLLLGNGDGTFRVAPFPPVAQTSSWITTIRPGGASLPDVLVVSRGWKLLLLKNLGEGRFAEPVEIKQAASPMNIAAGDLDGDGEQDLAVLCTWMNRLSLLKGDGRGGFTESDAVEVSSIPAYLVATDLNRDGKADLALTTWRSDAGAEVWILLQP